MKNIQTRRLHIRRFETRDWQNLYEYFSDVERSTFKIRIVVFVMLCLSFTTLTYAEENKVGDVVDQVLETDIVASIDGFPIPSMNINGDTVIIAENLRYYGFNVAWSPTEKSLVITKSDKNNINPLDVTSAEKIVVGKKIGDILHTDIKTYINGKIIKSYNIDGNTAILMSDLSEWGKVNWNPESRKMSFISDNSKGEQSASTDKSELHDYTFEIEITETINLDLVFKDQKYYFKDKVAGFNDQFAKLSVKFLADQLGYKITESGSSITVQKDNYSFKITGNSNKVQRYYSGLLYQTNELSHKAVQKNGDLYLSDTDVAYVFGLGKFWDELTGDIQLIYSDYNVKDYGIYDITGELFKINTVMDVDPSLDHCMCFIYNKTLDEHGGMGGRTDEEIGKYVQEARVMLASGHNELETEIEYDGRILMLKTIKNIVPNYKMNHLELEPYIGRGRFFKIVTPTNGYIETTEKEIPLKGELPGGAGTSIRVKVEKLETSSQTFIEVYSQNIDMNDPQFNDLIRLNDGSGLYKISAYTRVSELHETLAEIKVFTIFVQKN